MYNINANIEYAVVFLNYSAVNFIIQTFWYTRYSTFGPGTRCPRNRKFTIVCTVAACVCFQNRVLYCTNRQNLLQA